MVLIPLQLKTFPHSQIGWLAVNWIANSLDKAKERTSYCWIATVDQRPQQQLTAVTWQIWSLYYNTRHLLILHNHYINRVLPIHRLDPLHKQSAKLRLSKAREVTIMNVHNLASSDVPRLSVTARLQVMTFEPRKNNKRGDSERSSHHSYARGVGEPLRLGMRLHMNIRYRCDVGVSLLNLSKTHQWFMWTCNGYALSSTSFTYLFKYTRPGIAEATNSGALLHNNHP